MKTSNVRAKSQRNKIMIAAASIALAGVVGGSFMATGAFAGADYQDGWYSPNEVAARSLERAQENAQNVALRAAEEGIVLLKNENNALPLIASSDTHASVSVFGKNSNNPIFGGTGSAAGSGVNAVTLQEGLNAANIDMNPTLQEFYETSSGRRTGGQMRTISMGFQVGETPYSEYTEEVINSYANYNDAALVMISRSGGEGFDLPTSSYSTTGSNASRRINGVTTGRTDPTEHYLELDDDEKALIQGIKDSNQFDKIIILVNAANPMELGVIQDDPDIDAALYIGFPGDQGFAALGRILNGTVNPSGRTVDTFARDFTADPTYKNFAVNNVFGVALQDGVTLPEGIDTSALVAGPRGNQFINETTDAAVTNGAIVEYEEGIYVGYRYWETRGYTELQADSESTWYNDNVVYPLGYGLSYTTFEKEVTSWSDANLAKDGTITVEVQVTNTGSAAGKEVVQLYYSAPYTTGGIEKSHVVLGAFAKTGLLQPNASETVTLELKVEDMASYDYSDANENGYNTWELDGGDYEIYVGDNAHVWADANAAHHTFTVPDGGYQYEIDAYGDGDGNDNQMDEVSNEVHAMSRADFEGTFPVSPTVEERTKDAAFLSYLEIPSVADRNADDEGKAWYATEMPTYRAADAALPEDAVMLADLYGKDYDDPLWEQYLDQFTIEQMAYMVANGSFVAGGVTELGMPTVITPDGSTGLVPRGSNYRGATWASYCVLAGTYNVELMRELGEAWGEEAFWTNSGGIYAPATNTHRSPFAGRNFEYFSEDGLLAGKIVTPIIQGMQSKGLMPLTKHFAFNDQETDRERVTTWLTEQSAREIYLKSFEMAVVDGGSMGIMSSYNCIGTTWASAYYPLLTGILRDEWGFQGAVISDYGQSWFDVDAMIRGGTNYVLTGFGPARPTVTEEALTATQVTALRNGAHAIANYVLHSSAMNRLNPQISDYATTERVLILETGSNNRDQAVNEVTFASPAFEAAVNGTVTYELAAGTQLPAGLRLNADGSLQVVTNRNTPTVEDGDYTISVVVLVDGNVVGQEITYTVTVTHEATADNLVTLLNEQAATINFLRDLLAEQGEDVTALEAQIEALEAQIASGDADLEAALEEANALIATLQQQIATLQASNGDLQDQIDEVKNGMPDTSGATALGAAGLAIGCVGLAGAGVALFFLFKKKNG